MLAQVLRSFRTHVHAALDDLGIYRGQVFLLGVLWEEEGLTQSDLAERTWVQPATVSTTLQRMEQAGLVVRRPDPEDRRATCVYLTERGRALREPVREIWQDVEMKTFAGFSPAERELMRALLARIHQNLSEGDPEGAQKGVSRGVAK
jgi:DNA-binding MarR family transcriptional regulator